MWIDASYQLIRALGLQLLAIISPDIIVPEHSKTPDMLEGLDTAVGIHRYKSYSDAAHRSVLSTRHGFACFRGIVSPLNTCTHTKSCRDAPIDANTSCNRAKSYMYDTASAHRLSCSRPSCLMFPWLACQRQPGFKASICRLPLPPTPWHESLPRRTS